MPVIKRAEGLKAKALAYADAKTKTSEANVLMKTILSGKVMDKKLLLQAVDLYSESIDIKPTAEAYICLAYISYISEEIKAAVMFLKSALQIEPENKDGNRILNKIKENYGSKPHESKNLSSVNKILLKEEDKIQSKTFKNKLPTLKDNNRLFSNINRAKK